MESLKKMKWLLFKKNDTYISTFGRFLLGDGDALARMSPSVI
jgi:hypothetical protein